MRSLKQSKSLLRGDIFDTRAKFPQQYSSNHDATRDCDIQRLPSIPQCGSSLIENLVAVVITATGVLGAAAMQLDAVKFNQTASMRSAAVFLANDIFDRMRANRADALIGGYDLAIDDDAPAGDEIYQLDVREWLGEVGTRLPGGDGSVVRDGSDFTITVQWNERRLAKSREANSGDIESCVFRTRL